MWIFPKRGTLFATTFLAIITLSHAFVFWIPVWRRESVLRFQPRKGWLPIKTRGSGLGIFPKKHFGGGGVRDSAGGTSLHHIYSKLFPKIHHFPLHHPSHSPHHHHKPRLPPLFNLNHHHPLCPLCHLHSHHHRPHHHSPQHKKPFHFANSGSSHKPFFRSHHHPFSFSPSSSPKYSNYFPQLFKTLSHSPPKKFSSQFNSFPSKSFFDFPPHFQDFPSKFNSPFPPSKMNDFPKKFTSYNPNPYKPYQQTHSNNNYNYNTNTNTAPKHPKKSSKPTNYYDNSYYDYPDYSSSKVKSNPQSSYSYSPGNGYSYNDNFSYNTNNYKKAKKNKLNYYNFYNDQPQMTPNQNNEITNQFINPNLGNIEFSEGISDAPHANQANSHSLRGSLQSGGIQPQSQPAIGELPSAAKEFGFSGFGNGEKGHGWAGWDW